MLSGRPLKKITLLALALLALASWWLKEKPRPTQGLSQEIHEAPDYFMNHFSSYKTNSKGELYQRLMADRMAHHKNSDETELETPLLKVYKDHELQWQIKGRQGVIKPGGEDLVLQGDIELYRPATTKDQSLRLYTEQLEYQSKPGIVSTDLPVTIKSEQGTTQAVGLRAYLNEEKILLLSQVRGVYEPK